MASGRAPEPNPQRRRVVVATATLDPPLDGTYQGDPYCCPHLHETVELIGKRWSGAIVYVLLQGGTMRFSQIAHAVPDLSDRLLSERLKELRDALAELKAWGDRWLL